MPTSVAQFLEQLRLTGLASEEELHALEQIDLASDPAADAEPLAQRLVREKKLTLFQATQVYRGRGAALVLGNYLVLEKLGQGGMGVVYKARHRVMDRVVALKVLPAALAKDEQAVRRFQREVKAAAQLVHPNVVTAYDADEAQGNLYLVMEFVDGQDLSTVVRQRGALSLAETVDFTLQAAKGLEYAHGVGVVHRDIKPGNLLLSRDGVVKILDLGLARCNLTAVGAAAVDDDLTRSGQVLGTVDYMAPEQSYDTRDADHRSDIYSLGCTLYRLLTGEPPYVGDSAVQRVMAHRDAPVPRLRERRPEVPMGLDALCERMMAKRPEDRPQSMREVVAELKEIADELGSPSRKTDSEVGVASPVPGYAADTQMTFVQGAFDTRRHSTEGQSNTQAVPATASTRGSPQRQAASAARPPRRRIWLVVGGAIVALGLLFAALAWFDSSPSSDNRKASAGSEASQGPSAANAEAGKTSPLRKTKIKGKLGGKNVLTHRHVLIVVPFEGFWIPDFEPVRDGLTAAGVNVQIATSQRAPAVGRGRPEGMQVTPDLTVSEAITRAAEFDAVCFTGKARDDGPNEFARGGEQAMAARQLLREMRDNRGIVAGLCRGTIVLHDAGVLNGHRAARSDSIEPRKNDQVTWVRDEPVVRDGHMLTGANPQDAAAFTQRLIEMLIER